MDIINKLQERLPLSFAQHASLRYWGKIILEQLHSRTDQSVQLSQLVISSSEQSTEGLVYAKANIGLNLLCFYNSSSYPKQLKLGMITIVPSPTVS